jgi:hypothetical protein
VAPGELLETLRGIGGDSTLFYIEVPLEVPVAYDPVALLAPSASGLSRAKARIQAIAPVYDTYLRLRGADLPERRVTMHEHINVFSERSLKTMLAMRGFRLEYMATAVIDAIWADVTVISCIARKAT